MQSAKFHIIPQSFACAKIIKKKLCTSLVQGNLYREVELYLHFNELVNHQFQGLCKVISTGRWSSNISESGSCLEICRRGEFAFIIFEGE